MSKQREVKRVRFLESVAVGEPHSRETLLAIAGERGVDRILLGEHGVTVHRTDAPSAEERVTLALFVPFANVREVEL